MSNKEEKKIELFVPGRLCLFGEHTDWAGTARTINAEIIPGRAIVTGIEQGIHGIAQKNKSFCVVSSIEEYAGDSFECEMDMMKLREEAKKGGFFSYVAGVASYMSEWYHVGGIKLEITRMDLPMKSGLSSSAAICVMVARAFNILYDLHLNTVGVMNIAYWGELRTPSRCGRLDQACAFGVNPIAMTFDGNEILVDRISIKKPLYYVFANLMAGKNTVKILADLNKAYPFAHDEKENRLHEALGKDNQEITKRAIEYITNGDTKALGGLMDEAQKLFDEKVAPMCPEELTAPVLHSVFDDVNVRKYIYGAKGVGSQGDGTVQLLAKDEDCQNKLDDYLKNVRKMTTYKLTLSPKTVVKKAIIPVAGFGTRMYPESRGIKKEFLPVVDRDSMVKPAILILLEELDKADIDHICLVLNREEKEIYDNFFFRPLSDSHYDKLPVYMKEYEKKIRRISKKLSFVYQDEQLGFGHAVYQANEFAGGDPVMLLLGDTIYESATQIPCTKQLLDAYAVYGVTTVGLQQISPDEVENYGIFSGVWENKEHTSIKLNRIVEKPSVQEAKDYLCMDNEQGDKKCMAAFGAYVLTRDVFDRLEYAISNSITNSRGEVDLTEALAYVCEKKGMMGHLIDGRSYDLGNAQSYRRAVAQFGRE